MTIRPTRFVVGLELVALLAAAVVAVLSDGWSNWNLPLLATLTAVSIVSDLIAIKTRVSGVSVSASLMTIVLGAVLLGGAPAALMGVVTILAGWARYRYAGENLLINLVTYAWFPLIAGLVFHETVDAGAIETGSLGYYLLIVAVFVLALVIDFILIAGYSCYVERSSFLSKVQRGMLPVLPSELAASMLALGFAAAYIQAGAAAVALLSVIILTFQYVVGALLALPGPRRRARAARAPARRVPGRAALGAAADARPARPDDRAPQRRGRPLLARDRRPRRALGRRPGARALRRRSCTTSASSSSPTTSSSPAGASSRTPSGRRSRRTPTRARGSSRRSTATSRSARSSSPITSASTARATRAGSPTRRSPSSPRSSRSPTPTT